MGSCHLLGVTVELNHSHAQKFAWSSGTFDRLTVFPVPEETPRACLGFLFLLLWQLGLVSCPPWMQVYGTVAHWTAYWNVTEKPAVTTSGAWKTRPNNGEEGQCLNSWDLEPAHVRFPIEIKCRHLPQVLLILGLLGGRKGCSRPLSVFLEDLHSALSSSEKLNLFISSVGVHPRAWDIVHVGDKSLFWMKDRCHWKNTFVSILRYSPTYTCLSERVHVPFM